MSASQLKNIETTNKFRRASIGTQADALTDIYENDVNIAVWQRPTPRALTPVIDQLLEARPGFQLSINASPEEVPTHLKELLAEKNTEAPSSNLLIEDIANAVNMFCCLFDLQRVGLRLTALEKAMCPKFHVDRVPARLITTYCGLGTEWLPHERVDRKMLGLGSAGLRDHESGIYMQEKDIQQLKAGDIAILKGESWEGNEDAGLVHRSPSLKHGERRLLLTLDFMG